MLERFRRSFPARRDDPRETPDDPRVTADGPPEAAAPVTVDEPPPAVDPWANPPAGHDPAPRPPAAPEPASGEPATPERADSDPAQAVDPAPAAEPALPTGPRDLPGTAPTIGRAAPPQLGQVNPAIALRPPAVALDGTSAGGFRVAAASLIGAGHLVSGQPRQDSYNFMVGESGRLYVAVADGLGSKPASQLGANLFTESVLIAAAQAEKADPQAEPDPAELLAQASTRTARVVEEAYRLDPRTVGFVGAVAVLDERGCRMARVGDVSAFTMTADGFDEAFTADEGPLNVVSASMPGEKPEQVELVEVAPAGVVAFGTDGFANDLRTSGALREWLAGQWRVPHLPFAIGDTLRYRRQGSHDDRTAVVVWRTGGDDAP
ncbi:protein phosphatase 2C domain-containing protein [Paractinoplanes lichenicola]|uniref:Protein phosphatase 2C domain-containing protein n=1 Tax=Paractinoplanes lichenicola TaxID=2802976 RepID=A0ABS1VU55_9ACTN|nr:protein phosphatase 2C domain-containing protein [Actinoplanes lichenicola]MBL7258019.1 protein phosphatase 2C domain-containing protein [Actinoplanes lichenicola]